MEMNANILLRDAFSMFFFLMNLHLPPVVAVRVVQRPTCTSGIFWTRQQRHSPCYCAHSWTPASGSGGGRRAPQPRPQVLFSPGAFGRGEGAPLRVLGPSA